MGETTCSRCGEVSNSDPGLTCGRAMGIDEDGDEALPPYCEGVTVPPPKEGQVLIWV